MDDHEIEATGNVFVCPVCKRREQTDKRFCDCSHCGEPMVPYAEWKRRHQRRDDKKGQR